MSKEYYKKRIIDLRAAMAKEKEAKNVITRPMLVISSVPLVQNTRLLIESRRLTVLHPTTAI